MLKVKVCGICNLDDALLCVRLGVDALGFNFYQKSLRYVQPSEAQSIIKELPSNIWSVGVFVNQSKADIDSILEQVALNTLQFHGEEEVSFCRQWPEMCKIKAFRVRVGWNPGQMLEYDGVVDHLLLDSFSEAAAGGSGKQIDDDLLNSLKDCGLLGRAFLAGGINPANLADKVKRYQPLGVDLASGVETTPRKKDAEKLARLMEIARRGW